MVSKVKRALREARERSPKIELHTAKQGKWRFYVFAGAWRGWREL